jgi:hypothetical protein
VRREAHTLAGLFGNFDAKPARRIAHEIDRGIRDGQSARLTEKIDILEHEFHRFEKSLSGWLENEA